MADQEQCVFCHIASGKIPAKKVFDDDKVAVVLDINPATPGHLLVIPKQHVAIMPQMQDDLIAHLGMVAKQISASLVRALKLEGTSVFVANGVAAGQRAPHFLLHVIPRAKDDGVGLQLPVIQIDQQANNALFEKLGPAVAKQFGKEFKPVKHEKTEPAKPTEKAPEQKPAEKAPDKPVEKTPEKKGNLDEITKFLAGGK